MFSNKALHTPQDSKQKLYLNNLMQRDFQLEKRHISDLDPNRDPRCNNDPDPNHNRQIILATLLIGD